jgi:hypothetical protein
MLALLCQETVEGEAVRKVTVVAVIIDATSF